MTDYTYSADKFGRGECPMNTQSNYEHDMLPEKREQLQLIEVFLSTVKHFFGGFKELFSRVDDPRDQDKTVYPLPSLVFVGIMMFLCRLGSRRQINDKLRNNGPSAEKFFEIFQVETLPHGDTLNYLFKQLDPQQIEKVVSSTVQTLIRKKILYPYRLFGHYTIAIDGTGMLTFPERHCPHCLEYQHQSGSIYYHHVLEAKLVTENGFVFSLMTEFVENPDPDCTVQDCEIKAFYRMAERLYNRFPRLSICLLLDGLYAGGPTFSLCQRLRWKYIITLKDKDLSSINQEFDALIPLLPENNLTRHCGEYSEIEQDFSWVEDITYQDSFGCGHTVSVFQCLETKPCPRRGIVISKFKWITNFQIHSGNIAILANKGGRLRWKIENEGFNIQKNGGFELEHAYSTNMNSCKVFYFLMQIAHTIFQLIEKGSLFKQAFPAGVGAAKNIAFRLLEAWRNLRLGNICLAEMLSARRQIRFDSS